jgi:hypothetical protein
MQVSTFVDTLMRQQLVFWASERVVVLMPAPAKQLLRRSKFHVSGNRAVFRQGGSQQLVTLGDVIPFLLGERHKVLWRLMNCS